MATKSKKNIEYRYERKFTTNQLDFKEVESIVKSLPLMFKKIYQQRKVNSLYLDTMDHSNYEKHVSGVEKRLKIRIRWYGDTFGEVRDPVLEIKIRKGLLGRKKSYALKRFRIEKTFSWKSFFKEVFLKSRLPKSLLGELRFVKPMAIISYEREYFSSADKRYRITIDKNLCFYKVNINNNQFIEKGTEKELVVIEIKYNRINDINIRLITGSLPFRLTAMSKYLYAVDLLY
jgi:hypothetical protein